MIRRTIGKVLIFVPVIGASLSMFFSGLYLLYRTSPLAAAGMLLFILVISIGIILYVSDSGEDG
jgi:hypothetical protein